MEAPKSRCVRDVLPSIKPSFLSVVLVFFIGILWAKNEMTNERLSVLEEQMKKLTEARYVQTGLITRHEGISAGNITYSRKRSARKIQIPVQKRFDQLPVLRSEEESRARYRRRTVTNTTGALTIDQIRKEINRHFRNFTPLKHCRSNETVCPSGPPGLPGPQGTKGSRGRRGLKGTRGKTGPQGVMGPPGKDGKQGIMGPQGVNGPPGKDGKQGMMGTQGFMGPPGKDGKQGITGPQGVMGPPGKDGKQGITGPPGTRGDKGNQGPKGIAGPVGPPGESISVPRAVMSPTEQTRNEKHSAIFYCTVGGNPKPTVEWRFKGVKLYSGSKYSAKEGELKITQLNYSDAGKYSCAVESLLGSAEVSGNLLVRGEPVFTQVPPTLVTPTEGKTLQESCQAKGFPAPVLHWSRLIQPLPVGRTEVEKGNLTLRNLATVDSGLYECVASNSLGTRRSRMSVAVQKAVIMKDHCDCWRTRSRNPGGAWGYSSVRVDAIDFKANGVVTLQGYRLWGVNKGSGSYDVTIRLYRGDSLIAEKTGSYHSSSTDRTYEVFFSQEISLRAGLVYTAVAFIQGPRSFVHDDGITSALCSKVRVTFMKSSRDTNHSKVIRGQIPALIFRFSNC